MAEGISTEMNDELHDIAVDFANIQAVQFRLLTSYNGARIPYKIALREILAHPKIMQKVAKCMWKFGSYKNISYLCCVRFVAFPLATLMSVETNIPMIIAKRRTETVKVPKGIQRGSNCVIIEDEITNAENVIKIAKLLRTQGLTVEKVLAIIDNGKKDTNEILLQNNLEVSSLFTVSSLAKYHLQRELLDSETYRGVMYYLQAVAEGYYINDSDRLFYKKNMALPRAPMEHLQQNPHTSEEHYPDTSGSSTSSRQPKASHCSPLHKQRSSRCKSCSRCDRLHKKRSTHNVSHQRSRTANEPNVHLDALERIFLNNNNDDNNNVPNNNIVNRNQN